MSIHGAVLVTIEVKQCTDLRAEPNIQASRSTTTHRAAILLSVGSASPPILPDLTQEAADAAVNRTAETMQYGPLFGLADADRIRQGIARLGAAYRELANE